MRVENKRDSLSFNAKVLSQWRCRNKSGKSKLVTLVGIEKRDYDYFNKLSQNSDNYFKFGKVRGKIIKDTILSIKSIFENFSDAFDKTKMLMAVQNGKICGFLIGNIPKEDSVTDKIVYSSRHNPAKNETEVDWFVTWNPKRNEKISGIGKALVGEYFLSLKNDKFRDVYVRAELPENSYAVDFYESVGFERMGNKRAKLCKNTTSQYIVEDSSDNEDYIIPMIITRKGVKNNLAELLKQRCDYGFIKKSVDINEILE